MPTYEYECTACGYKFEAFQKISDQHLKQCPHCQKKVRRLISSGSGIIFKGSGFYATDYRSRGYKEKQKQETKSGTTQCPASSNNEACKNCSLNKDAP